MKNLSTYSFLCAAIFLAPTVPARAGLVNGGLETHYFGKLTAVDLDKNSVFIVSESDDEALTFPVALETLIIVNGKQGTIKDLTVGGRVKVDTWRRMGPDSAASMKVLAITVMPGKKHKK